MKKCSNCNQTYDDAKKFCGKCGNQLEDLTASTANESKINVPKIAKSFPLKNSWKMITIGAVIVIVCAGAYVFFFHSSRIAIMASAKCNAAEVQDLVFAFDSDMDILQAANSFNTFLKGRCHNLFYQGRFRLRLQTVVSENQLDTIIQNAGNGKLIERRTFSGPVGFDFASGSNLYLVGILFSNGVSDEQIRISTSLTNSIIQHICNSNEIMLWIPEPDSHVETLRNVRNMVETSLKNAGYICQIRSLLNVKVF